MLTALKRIFKSGWLGFKRNSGLSLATIFILALIIFLITSLFLIRGITNFLISDIQAKVDISVYFKQDSSEEEISMIKEELLKIPEVMDIEYTSRQEALDEFIVRHKDNPVLMGSLEEIGDNPFLASLNIKAWQANQYEAVASFLNDASFKDVIEKVDYYQRKPIIERIFSTTSVINKTGIGISILLCIVALLVTFNTIRLAIFNQKEEISIMRLVGASNWFIRGPFLIQGIISGLISVIITLLIFLPLCYFLSPKLELFIPGFSISSYFFSNFWLLLLIQIIAGIGIGILSSLIAIRKYLRV